MRPGQSGQAWTELAEHDGPLGAARARRRCRRTSFVENSVEGAARTAVVAFAFLQLRGRGTRQTTQATLRSANSFSFAEVDFLTLCPPADLPPFFGFGI